MDNQKKKAEFQKPQRKYSRPTTAIKHKKVLDNLVENGGNMAKAIRDTGLYSPVVANDPQRITESKTWNEILAEEFPDGEVTGVHKGLLKFARIEHMAFPLGPEAADPQMAWDKITPQQSTTPKPERTSLTDDEIITMFADVNCPVSKIIHRRDFRDVYFSVPDTVARDKALDKVYKLKGRYMDEPNVRPPQGNTYNFIFSAPVQEKINKLEGEIKDMLIKKKDAQ